MVMELGGERGSARLIFRAAGFAGKLAECCEFCLAPFSIRGKSR
jgi:hypothetical protein